MPMYVNQTEISDADVFQEMQHHPATNREAARDKAARALLIRELLRQEAIEKQMLTPNADAETAEKAIEQLLEREVRVPEATQEACRRYYDQNIERFSVSKDSKLPLPFETINSRIGDYLHTRSIRHGIQAYILDLASHHRVTGFDLAATL